MAYTIIATESKGGPQSGVESDAINTTGADLLVLVATWYPGVTTNVTITDELSGTPTSNTWNGLTVQDSGGVSKVRIYWCVPVSVGANHTFLATGNDTYPCVSVVAASGAHASPYNSQETGATATANNISTGAVTPSLADCLVIAGLAENAAEAAISINGGFTATTTAALGGVNVGGGIAYLIQTSAVEANPNWSWADSTNAAAAIAVFKPATSGGGKPAYAYAQQ